MLITFPGTAVISAVYHRLADWVFVYRPVCRSWSPFAVVAWTTFTPAISNDRGDHGQLVS